ncbi:uncharacterized protein LOC144143299 [Haemaphysalis longicornis]
MQDNPAAASAVTASFKLRTPPQFTFDNPAQWTAWLQQFEDYSFASGLSSAPEETKVHTLLYCMGPQGLEVLSSLMSDAEAYRSYSGVTTSLSGYFVHPVNEVYESSRFHKRTQAVGLSVDAFFTALRNLVKKCNYASREIDDRLVRDRFIVGLLDSRSNDQLCRNPKLTLDEALIQARQYGDAENEKRRCQGTGFAPDALNVDAVANKQYRMAAAPACETARSNVCRPPEYRAGPKTACDFCGHAPHPRSECPARPSFNPGRRLEDFKSHQTSDGECSMLKAYSMKGWPRRDRLPLNMTRYWEHRGDFTICEDVLSMGGRLVVPEARRRDIVNLLHDGHHGVNRCLAVARDSVWWPGLNSQAILSQHPQMTREAPTLRPRHLHCLPDHSGQQPVTHRTLQLLHLLQDRQATVTHDTAGAW